MDNKTREAFMMIRQMISEDKLSFENRFENINSRTDDIHNFLLKKFKEIEKEQLTNYDRITKLEENTQTILNQINGVNSLSEKHNEIIKINSKQSERISKLEENNQNLLNQINTLQEKIDLLSNQSESNNEQEDTGSNDQNVDNTDSKNTSENEVVITDIVKNKRKNKKNKN